MNELQKAVADLILKATQAAEAAGKFAVEQLPDVAQQYVLYVAVTSWLWVAVGLAIMSAPIWMWRATKSFRHSDDRWAATIGSGFIGALIGGLFISSNLSTAIMATVAPKVLLIKWAAELVK